MKKINFSKSATKELPEEPGIYIFANKKDSPLYVGKSTNLKNRVNSYFSKNLGNKTKKMIEKAKYVKYIQVESELESLLLEAKLVKKYKPDYNIQLRDDKHPLYIKITSEKYPRVITSRKHGIDTAQAIYGPFPSSKNVRQILKFIRRIFPYAQHKIGKRACLHSQIGLCNPCPNVIESTSDEVIRKKTSNEYKSNIKMIKRLLSGNLAYVRKDLEKKMTQYSKGKAFEKAQMIKERLERLDYITQPITPVDSFIKNPNLIEDIRNNELSELKIFINILSGKKYVNFKRIECFDVAHLKGIAPTASMVTFINAEPDKSLYRHFKIRQNNSQSDTDSLKEIAKRRIKYIKKWGKPDLVLVDGGRGQVTAFKDIFNEQGIPVLGIAKSNNSLVYKQDNGKFVKRKVPKGHALNLVQRLRDEAHRFARRYHHKLLKTELIPHD